MPEAIDINLLRDGDRRHLARAISLVENNDPAGIALLSKLSFDRQVPVLGITGPPGAGKSSIVSSLVYQLLKENKKAGIVAIDPTSPFNHGSLLGDRIRMSEHFNNPDVFIRSLATRGSLGGLSARIFEITDLIKHAGFDLVIIETVGVGQSEVEIAGLADTTAVVLVPEAGDEVQTLKSGLMEIADMFIVNKADREGADVFVKNLRALVMDKPESEWKIPVLKTVATTQAGMEELWKQVQLHNALNTQGTRKLQLVTEKAWQLIMQHEMQKVDRALLVKRIEEAATEKDFNLYSFLNHFYFS